MTTLTPDTPPDEPMVWMSFALPRSARDEIKEHAHLARISASELVRRHALNQSPPKAAVPAVNVQLRADLGPVGNNLNQLLQKIHKAGEVLPSHVAPLGRVLVPLKALLDQVRLELVGAYRAHDQADKEDQA